MLASRVLVGIASCLLSTVVLSSQKESQQELAAVAESLKSKPSMSEAPVDFSVLGVHYRVPRNYLIHMDNWEGGPQILVEFRVTFPGFAPRRPDTVKCLDGPISFTGHECARQDFFISKRYPASAEEALMQNLTSRFSAQSPQHDSYGFEEYNTGPPTARIVTFRKRVENRWLVFECIHMGEPDAAGSSDRDVCTRRGRLPSGNELGYHFYEGQLPVIEEKDDGLRRLVQSFQVSRE